MSTERPAARKPRILVTRAVGQASALAAELERLGAEPIIIPVIEIVAPDSYGALDSALRDFGNFHWAIFTSANAVPAAVERARLLGITLASREMRIAAIGSATARALASAGVRVDLVPPIAVAESLTETLLPLARQPDASPTRFLLIRAQESRELLPNALRGAGAQVTVASAYKTQPSEQGTAALRECLAGSAEGPEGLTLTSSSAAVNFFGLLRAAKLSWNEGTAIASIGPVTSQTLRDLGYMPHVEAQEATVASLAKAIVELVQERTTKQEM